MIPTIVTLGVLAVSLLSGIIAVSGIARTLLREADANRAAVVQEDQQAAQQGQQTYQARVSKPTNSARSQHRAQ